MYEIGVRQNNWRCCRIQQQQNGLVNETNMTLLAKVVLYKNMSFNESGEYKKTMIGSGVGTGSTQVLHGFEFEVEPLGDHTFEVEPQDNVDQGADVYICQQRFCRKCNDDSDGLISGEYTPGFAGKGQRKITWYGYCSRINGNTLKVYTDFDYAMERLITVMGRSITRYGLMILGCAGSLKANLQHMKALSTTKAGYMTFTEAWKKEIWLKGLLTEFRNEIKLRTGIAKPYSLVKGDSRSKVPAQVEVAAYRY
ncbi:hypothetical protein Tco_0635362 [Tanacetum coccineum]